MSSLLHSDPDDSSEENLTHSFPAQEVGPPRQEQISPKASIFVEKNKVVRQPDNSSKLAVRLLAIGSTTAILPSAFTVAGTQTVAAILKFIMRKLGLETIHIYVLNSFQPTPDETMGQLHAMFSTNGVLNLSYCENIAFG